MSFKLKTQLKLAQKLSMTTQLQQSINLLSLNHQEVQEALQNELLENPVLQTEEDNNYENEDHKTKEDVQDSINDWAEEKRYSSYSRMGSESKEAIDFDKFTSQTTTLKDHLIWQAQVSDASKEIKNLMTFLIFNLDEHGYLNTSLEEIAKKEGVKTEDLQEALSYLQTLDPVGVGARSVQECLLIQARHLEEDTRDLTLIIKNHLENIKNKNYKLIASSLGISIEEVLECYNIIKTMDPFPARNFSSQPTEYIAPDIYLVKEAGDYKVVLNDEGIPNLMIDRHYKKILGTKNRYHADMKKYIKGKIKQGDWFIRAFAQRQSTIRRVAESIVKHQRDFLDKGPMFLKPLILKDIADDISVHVSTVSRVTANKYIHTEQGLLPLKYFFNTSTINNQGVALSLVVIKEYIKKWVSEEDQTRPISDKDIVDRLLQDLDLSVSRRVVAQYRDSIGILSANKRRIARIEDYSLTEAPEAPIKQSL